MSETAEETVEAESQVITVTITADGVGVDAPDEMTVAETVFALEGAKLSIFNNLFTG